MKRFKCLIGVGILSLGMILGLGGCGLVPGLTDGNSSTSPTGQTPVRKNIILLIGDGMGMEQVKAASLYQYGQEGQLRFESFPYSASIRTAAANNSITDSAAAATAIATGVSVNNGVISQRTPGDDSELKTLLEHYQEQGKAVGLVTTTYITHATPAAFGAHEPSRGNTTQIGQDLFTDSQPNILFGGGGNGVSEGLATQNGYEVVTSNAGLTAVNKSLSKISGQFGVGYLPYEVDGLGDLPRLTDMTSAALDALDDDPDGFFLMVEGGRIDHACHSNDLTRALGETAEFERMLIAVLSWASSRDDTLILITADHETGGLTVVSSNGVGVLPSVSWSSFGHTAANVGVWAIGPGADVFTGTMNNTEIVSGIIGTDLN